MNIKVTDEGGHVRISLVDGADTVGVASLKTAAYHEAVRKLVSFALKDATATLKVKLGELIWTEAIRAFGDDTERAMKKIAEFGWTQVNIDRFAEALARDVIMGLTEHLPEHQ